MIPDYIVIQKLSEGDNKAFAAFYKENREPFFRHFVIYFQQESQAGFTRMKFKDGDMYLDDLYQTSCIRLFEMVNIMKIYVHEGTIYYVNRKNENEPIKGSLLTLLKQIGFNVLREMTRTNWDSGHTRIDDILRKEESENSLPDDFIDDPGEENFKVAIVRDLMTKMTDTCRKIFKALYDNDDNENVKGVDVVESLGYASPESFRNQKARCVNKFKVAFEAALAKK